jgi:hypothetical protein
MELKDARLLMKALDLLIEQSNIPLRVAHDYCTEELHEMIVKICVTLVDEVDHVIRPKLIKAFPDLKGWDGR